MTASTENSQALLPAEPGWGDLLDLTIERLVAPVEDMQRAMADPWLAALGTSAVPARRTFHAVTSGVYGTVRFAGSTLGKSAGFVAAARRRSEGLPPLADSSVAHATQAIANALWGDELERRSNSLRLDLGLRDRDGLAVSPDVGSLASTYPDATGRVAVLLHGLGQTEDCWLQADAADLTDTLTDAGFTPLLVRYNTGRTVAESGAALAAVLDEVASNWPIPVEEIVLVGFSMGGLVARRCVQEGRDAGHGWPEGLSHLVAIGSPHLGSPIEKGVDVASRLLSATPQLRPLAQLLDHRSPGIKDLRHGAEVDETSLDGVDQHFIAGVVTSESTHPVGVLIGDLVVRVASSTGRGARRRVEATNVEVIGGQRHLELPSDPVVHDQVRCWLTSS